MKSAVKKVRVSLYGSRKWVPKEDSVAFKGTMEKVVVDPDSIQPTYAVLGQLCPSSLYD